MMTTRIVFAVVLVLLFTGTVFPQAPTNEDHDVILLNDGGIARGRIIEIVCGDYVTIQVLEGKTVRVDYDDIRLITDKEQYERFKGKLLGDCIKDRSIEYENIVRVELLRSNSKTHFAGEFIIGPRISRNFYCGMGIGWQSLADDLLSAQLHIYFIQNIVENNNQSVELFLHFSGGYAYNATQPAMDPMRGGAKYMFTFGSAFEVGGGTALLVEAGYGYQAYRESPPDGVRSDLGLISLGVRF